MATYTRSAKFFKRLAKSSSEHLYLTKLTDWDKTHEANLQQNKDELIRVYNMIENSAKGGGIRIFLPNKDPIWNNSTVLFELQKQGFQINTSNHTDQGVIEWYDPTKFNPVLE